MITLIQQANMLIRQRKRFIQSTSVGVDEEQIELSSDCSTNICQHFLVPESRSLVSARTSDGSISNEIFSSAVLYWTDRSCLVYAVSSSAKCFPNFFLLLMQSVLKDRLSAFTRQLLILIGPAASVLELSEIHERATIPLCCELSFSLSIPRYLYVGSCCLSRRYSRCLSAQGAFCHLQL